MRPINIICFNCKNKANLWGVIPNCNAFPDGIPKEIFYEGNQHYKPLPSQKNNIVFELLKK